MNALKSAIGRKLGEGGTATVHESVIGDRRVAIKRLTTNAATIAESRASLLEEARLLRASRHPNVVEVVDLFDDDEGPALVMELVDGESLAELSMDGRGVRPHGEEIVHAVALQSAAGLPAIHGAKDARGPLGIRHRNLPPVPRIGTGKKHLVQPPVHHNLHRHLPPISAIHRRIKRANNLIGGRPQPQRFNTRSDGGERNADHDADNGDHNQHLDERQSALRRPPPAHFDFQLTMSSFISTPPGCPSAP